MSDTSLLYRSFKRVLAHIATATTPSDELVLAMVSLRTALLTTLGLSANARNVDRLMLCGIAGLPLASLRRDAEAVRPRTVVDYFGSCFENQPPVSASRSAVNASMRS